MRVDWLHWCLWFFFVAPCVMLWSGSVMSTAEIVSSPYWQSWRMLSDRITPRHCIQLIFLLFHPLWYCLKLLSSVEVLLSQEDCSRSGDEDWQVSEASVRRWGLEARQACAQIALWKVGLTAYWYLNFDMNWQEQERIHEADGLYERLDVRLDCVRTRRESSCWNVKSPKPDLDKARMV